MKHLFIINPVAGGKKGRADEVEREVRSLTESFDCPFEVYLTTGSMDACRKVT